MATKGLTTNYLTKLTNANHDGVTQLRREVSGSEL